MKKADLIECAEAPLDQVIPLDSEGELREYFGIFSEETP